jgi:hypothetical protein
MYRWKHMETYHQHDFILCSILISFKTQSSCFFESFIEVIIYKLNIFIWNCF